MDDRKLLELAAKAAGYLIQDSPLGNFLISEPGRGQRLWNPFLLDGDAFRLAVALRLDVEFQFGDDCDSVSAWRPGIDDEFVDSNGDRMAAARRAIVMSAAQVGMSSLAAQQGPAG